MYKPATEELELQIRKAGFTRHVVFKGWGGEGEFADIPYIIEFVRKTSDSSRVSKIAECYMMLDHPVKLSALHMKEHERLTLDLPYKILFMKLVIEHLIELAKSIKVRNIVIETRVFYMTEIFLDLGFEIRVLNKGSEQIGKNPRTKYRGLKKL